MRHLGIVASARVAPAGVGGLVAEDTFTRANSTTLGSTEVGSFAWTELSGDLAIDGNAVYGVYGEGRDSRATFDPGVSDCTITVNYRTSTAGDRSSVGIIFRGVDANNFWLAEFNDTTADGGNRATLTKFVSGTPTGFGSGYFAAIASSTDYELQIVLNGTSIDFLIDGVSRVSGTDSTHQTATRCGLRVYSASVYDDANSRIYDIKVESP